MFLLYTRIISQTVDGIICFHAEFPIFCESKIWSIKEAMMHDQTKCCVFTVQTILLQTYAQCRLARNRGRKEGHEPTFS